MSRAQFIADKEAVKKQLGGSAEITNVPKFFTRDIEVTIPATVQTTVAIQDTFIIGSDINAIKGVSPVGLDYGEPQLVSVVPANGVYVEDFVDDVFIDLDPQDFYSYLGTL